MSSDEGINYFICTLGQAARPDVSRPYQNVNHLIDQQAQDHGNEPAVGFYVPCQHRDEYEVQVLDFRQVQQGVLGMASAIAKEIVIPARETVALLSNSSPAFLFTWLGLIRLGHPVLLIAPQCSPTGIAQLSKVCHASTLFHDEAHEKLARNASEVQSNFDITIRRLPFEDDDEVFKIARRKVNTLEKPPSILSDDVAYLHHTSGTSTGIPKPIPQTHTGGVAVLPRLEGTAAATFTTTPLYHGGVADLFRAWSSTALIWLFPSQHFPITATNIVKCLKASDAIANTAQMSPIKYFSSVPYVLQMLAQDKGGMKQLQQMNIVGVGGAALPPEIGDQLVQRGVNLVSRYGSAECGFLMSSHRNYNEDREWQYLRLPDSIPQLKFEESGSGLSELIVLHGWPHMAKTNREDGSFATSDLFAQHPSIPGAWKYHSRADSQLTLITGKKFDPAPLEGSLAASSSMVSEVLIFGNGQPYPGALVFRSEQAKDESNEAIIKILAPVVEKLNEENPSHARVPRNMLVPMEFEPVPLEKSSKGTILRGQAEEKFRTDIESAYQKTQFTDHEVPDEDLTPAILKLVGHVVGTSQYHEHDLNDHTDLFSYGVDSVACIQIRHALSQLLPNGVDSLPLTVVEDAGTVSNLVDIISRLRQGKELDDHDNQSELIGHSIQKYGSFVEPTTSIIDTSAHDPRHTILLTGPTGLLGAHVLSQLLGQSNIRRIYLLVRGASAHAARERVIKSLDSRLLSAPNFDEKVHVMPCRFADSKLGLSGDDYLLLQQQVDKIFHFAWSVNFLVSLKSIASTHLAGLRNLLNLAIESQKGARFLFCSSIASVSNMIGKGRIPESIIEDYTACGSTGYAQSKLAAELICSRCSRVSQMKDRITVIRVGQLSGDSRTGIWNMSEAYPLILASSKATNVLPDLKNEGLNWLPVDIAAKCFIDAGLANDKVHVPIASDDGLEVGEREHITVLNLLNTSTATKFADITRIVKNTGGQIEVVSTEEWLKRLSQLQGSKDASDHPFLKLLPFWSNVYGSRSSPHLPDTDPNSLVNKCSDDSDGHNEGNFETALSEKVRPNLRSAIAPLTEAYLLKIWHWIQNTA